MSIILLIFFARNAHSHTIATLQPSSCSSPIFRTSLATFAANFSDQNSGLVEGDVANRQFSCLCQKHPRTSITLRHFGNTMSGRPGRWRS